MSLAKDLELLQVLPEASKFLTEGFIKQRFRDLAAQVHPDKGGDPAAFHELRSAHDRLLAWLAKPKRCRACQGAGKVNLSKTRTPLFKRCSACAGKGTVTAPSLTGKAADRVIVDEALRVVPVAVDKEKDNV